MKQTLLITFMSILLVPVFGQHDSLLKTFKFRNSNYRQIIFNVGGTSQYNRTEPGSGVKKSSFASGALGAGYNNTKSTDKILLTETVNFNTDFSSGRSNTSSGVEKSKYFNVAPFVTILNKWFTKNYFTELGAQAYGNIYANKFDYGANAPGISKNNQNEYSLLLNSGIGKGRLENVTDMQNALWLSKILQKENMLSHALTSAELDELGHSITAANNTRVLDSRKRTQFILETVDNYLQQKNLIAKTDVKYFGNLNDILFYAINLPRLSGTEKFIRLNPGISSYKNNDNQNNNLNTNKLISTVKSVALSTGFSKYVPASLTHQNNFGAALKFFYANVDFADRYYTSGVITNESKGNPELKQASLNLFFEHAIYPNTRTLINFNLQTRAGYQDVSKQTNWFGEAILTGTWNYFISYRTRLQFNAGGIYNKNIYQVTRYLEEVTNNLTLYVNAGLNISI